MKKDEIPTLDAYVLAATRLADLVRRAFNNPKSVKRSVLLKALEEFERNDFAAM
jgi:hypothetical protein